jgi:hypothetical protein
MLNIGLENVTILLNSDEVCENLINTGVCSVDCAKVGHKTNNVH